MVEDTATMILTNMSSIKGGSSEDKFNVSVARNVQLMYRTLSYDRVLAISCVLDNTHMVSSIVMAHHQCVCIHLPLTKFIRELEVQLKALFTSTVKFTSGRCTARECASLASNIAVSSSAG